jgi:enediyne biosynthesis protein E4
VIFSTLADESMIRRSTKVVAPVALATLAAILSCTTRAPESGVETPIEAPPEQRGPPLFEDVASRAGIDFTYRNGEESADHYAILESLGGGAGLLDYDGDGLLDILLTGGGGYAGPDGKEIVGRPCALYRNCGGFRFEDVTAKAGLDRLASGKPWFYNHGVAVADYDRDGWPDLLVTGWRAVALFHNVPVDPARPGAGRRFEDVTTEAGLGSGIQWATSAAFADLDGDGRPDLYVCQYVDWSWDNHPRCSTDGVTRDVCPPRNFSGLTHRLYRNTGEGTFVEVGRGAGLNPGGPNSSKGLGVLILDLDGDGRPDIYVANDTTDKFLYLNRSTPGRLAFEEKALASNCARDDRGVANGSMGLDAGDPFRAGAPALWVTNYENELHALYQFAGAAGKPFFTYRSMSAGIGVIGRKYVGWGTAFLDADRDGWEDLFAANGHAIRRPLARDSARKQRPVLLVNEGGKFVSAPERLGAYGLVDHNARGVAAGDLDNDGRPDLVISHLNEPVAVLRGQGGASRHWLGMDLEGENHACAVGAVVVFEGNGGRQTRFARGGGSYASAPDRRLLFGLGDDVSGRVTITWPGGGRRTFEGVKADRYYRASPQSANLTELLPPRD